MAITLEQWIPASLELLRRCNTPEMTAHLGGPESEEKLLARHDRYLGFWEAEQQSAWPYRIVRDGEDVGSLSYWRLGPDAFEIGWAVPTANQGQGIARAGVTAALADMRARGHRGEVHATPSVENLASNALARSLGFTLEKVEEIEYPPGNLMTANDWVLRLL